MSLCRRDAVYCKEMITMLFVMSKVLRVVTLNLTLYGQDLEEQQQPWKYAWLINTSS